MDQPETKSSPSMIAFAWIVVLIPLAWGVSQTVVKSLPLFRISAAANLPSSGKH